MFIFRSRLIKALLLGMAFTSFLATAQTVQLNSINTTCTSITVNPTASGFNIVPTPSACLSVGGGPQQPTTPFGGTVTVNIAGTATVAEGSTVNIPVNLLFNGGALPSSNIFSGSVTVNFAATNGTAVSGTNYSVATASPLTIPAGSTTGFIQVSGINDMVVAGNKTFSLTLSNPVIQNQGAGTATTALGTTTSTVTVTDAGAPAAGNWNIAVNGATIPDPSQIVGVPIPPAHSGLNGAGNYVKAWEVPTTGCVATPALAKLYQHNIEYWDFRFWAVQARLAPNEALVYTFVVPNKPDGTIGAVTFSENTQGMNVADFVTISKNRCDFDTAKAAANNKCYRTGGGTTTTMSFKIHSSIASDPSYCVIKPGDRVYVNYRFQHATSSPLTDSCADQGQSFCGTTITFK